MASSLANNSLPPSTKGSEARGEERPTLFLAWLDQLIQEHGPGEYLVQVRADGSVVVKRPRKPLEFEWR
jgi:hypothetical protein